MVGRRQLISHRNVLNCLLLTLWVHAAQAQAQVAPSCTPVLAAENATFKEAALEAFREHRYASAYGRFARLADAGDTQAAAMALLMLRQGPELFGSQWSASERQQICWNTLVINFARFNRAWVGNPAGD
jgi:hypothetical protein